MRGWIRVSPPVFSEWAGPDVLLGLNALLVGVVESSSLSGPLGICISVDSKELLKIHLLIYAGNRVCIDGNSKRKSLNIQN